MTTRPMHRMIEHLRDTMRGRDGAGLSDAQLLECFLRDRAESAFEVLLHRHGPMVLGVCRRMLGNAHDVEDAFQATFLVLVRKARSIRSKELVGNWLYGVAYQTALKARAAACKRQSRERQVNVMPDTQVEPHEPQADLLRLLDQELSRLPDKYRAAIVLCDLEGRSRQEAAAQFGVPEGTLSSRLTRGRTMLAKRLTRHGLAYSGGAVATLLAQQTVSANVTSALSGATVKAASALAAGQVVATLVSANVAVLSDGVMRMLLLTKLKKLAAATIVTGALALSCVMMASGQSNEPERAVPAAAKTKVLDEKKKPAAPPQAQIKLTLVRVRGVEFKSRHLEGEFKGKDVRNVVLSCEVVLENNTGDELTVLSQFFSAYDGLSLVVIENGKPIREQHYTWHQSLLSEPRPYVLKMGKNTADLRFPLSPAAENWPSLQVKLVGTLPKSKFKDKLESNVVKIERVDNFDPPKKKEPVSLILSKAVAERRGNSVYIHCDARVDNDTGKDLNVKSTFYSAFDGIELAVTGADGKLLAQPKCIDGKSPFTPKGRDFPLKQGSTPATLRFTVAKLAQDVKTVKVRLVGTLPGSGYDKLLSSETIDVAVPPNEEALAKMVADLEKKGALFYRDEKEPGRPIIKVDMNQLFAGAVTDEMIDQLAQLTSLRDLQLGGRKITDADLKKVVTLSNLRILNLGGARITDDGFKELQRLPHLEDVWLAGTKISVNGLKHLAKVKSLKIAGFFNTAIDDAGVAALSDLTGLEGLHLSKTRVTDKGLAHLTAFPRLQKLWLGQNTTITNDGMKSLKTVPNLRTLYLDDTAISDDGVKQVSQLTELRELALGATKVTDAGVRHLASLKKLTYLSLGSTEVSDECLPTIGGLTELQGLQLGYTKISDRGLPALERLHALTSLDLYGAPVSKAAADKLKEKLPRCNMSVR